MGIGPGRDRDVLVSVARPVSRSSRAQEDPGFRGFLATFQVLARVAGRIFGGVVVGVVPLRAAPKLSVLVIDDDADIRAYLQDFLTLEGFEVTTVADPTFAITHYRPASSAR